MAKFVCEHDPVPCPYWQIRCFKRPGPRTRTSWARWSATTIGCFDAERQRAYFKNLHPANAASSDPAQRAADVKPATLPPFIPMMTEGMRRSHQPELPDLLFGVSLSSLLDTVELVEPKTMSRGKPRRPGLLHYNSAASLRKALCLPYEPVSRQPEHDRPDGAPGSAGARLALIGTAPDPTLETFWELSERRSLWKQIKGLELDFATSLTFSVWEGAPRFDQIFNQERNCYSYERLMTEGVPAVPFLFYADSFDRLHTLDWLARHETVSVVGALAQSHYQRERAFERFVAELSRLKQDLGRKLHFLIVGPATQEKIQLAFKRLGSVTIATSQPIMKAMWGFEIGTTLKYRKAQSSTLREELATRNIERYVDFCSRLAPSGTC